MPAECLDVGLVPRLEGMDVSGEALGEMTVEAVGIAQIARETMASAAVESGIRRPGGQIVQDLENF